MAQESLHRNVNSAMLPVSSYETLTMVVLASLCLADLKTLCVPYAEVHERFDAWPAALQQHEIVEIGDKISSGKA